MSVEAVGIIGLIITLLIGIITIWVSTNSYNNKAITVMTLQTQTLNNQNDFLKEIHDDSRGTYKIVEKTHEHVGEMQVVQACHSKEWDSHNDNVRALKTSVDDLPEKFRALLT